MDIKPRWENRQALDIPAVVWNFINRTVYAAALLLVLCVWMQPLLAQENPVEIRVMGRQPGPPMWLVKKDDHELWIFASLSPIPKDMIWESDKVAAVIARSQEYITPPDIDLDASPLLYLNPINIFRGMRLAKRLSRNQDGETLEDVLEPELYQRFTALKQQYFPRNKDIEKLRPIAAGGQMVREIQEQSNLVPGGDSRKQIRKLIKRNKNIIQTNVEVKMEIKGSYGSLAKRAENLMDSITPELEQKCFEYQLHRMETDIREMQLRADSWARGYIDEFKGIPLPGDSSDPCTIAMTASSELETINELLAQVSQLWLEAVEAALDKNATTFAVLEITEMLNENGVIAKLKAKGYEVRVP